jgi:hypothetical protein
VSEGASYLLVGLILLLTHFQEGITGFGCSVLALPFVVLILGLETAVPVLVILAWILALSIVIVSRREIVWREYGRIAVLSALGLPIGMWMSHALPEYGLKWVLALFMVGIGIHGLAARNSVPADMSTRKKWLLSGFIPLGGIIQGAFGSGGPLVVIYGARALPDKSVFRVTLCMVWVTVNSVLIAGWVMTKSLDPKALKIAAVCLPFTLTGMLLGNLVHHRVSDVLFRRIVYTVLIASGLAFVWSLVI